MKNITFLFMILIIYIPFKVKSDIIGNEDKNPSSKLKNDNIKFIKMLERGGEVQICYKLRIDLNDWKAITPQITKLTGKSENITIELLPNVNGMIMLFEELVDVEITNVIIKIESAVLVNSGIIKNIQRCKIKGFHVILKGLKIAIDEVKEFGLISNSIYSSELTDVGVIFNNLNIVYYDDFQQQRFSLISIIVRNEKQTNYKGIFIKGNYVGVEGAKSSIESGLLFYSVTNINFNYTVIDINYANFHVHSKLSFSFFIFRTESNVLIENIFLIIKNSFNYDDYDNIGTDTFISGLLINNYKPLIINYCSINIRFNEINFKFYEIEKNKSSKRNMYISAAIHQTRSTVKIYRFHVNVFFNKEYKTLDYEYYRYYCVANSFKCYRKAIKMFYFISHTTYHLIEISNSYFNINSMAGGMVVSQFIAHPNGVKIINCYVTDKYNSLKNNISGFVVVYTDKIFSSVKSIGYNVSNLIIYDPLLPYYNNNNKEVNYKVFTSKQPQYNLTECKNIVLEEESKSFFITIIITVSIITVFVIGLIYVVNEIESSNVQKNRNGEENLEIGFEEDNSYSRIDLRGDI